MNNSPASNRKGHPSTRSTALRLFLTCWLVYALHFATNTVREIYPALSLGDHLSFDVSEYAGMHPDIFELPGRGAFINNNPGASIVGAVPYALARPVIDRVVAAVQRSRAASGMQPPTYNSVWPMAREFYLKSYERGLDIKFGMAAGVMQALAMAPLSALSVVVMFYILRSLFKSERKALWLAVLYAFATPVFYRTAQLNHNLLQAHSALFAFVLLWRPWDDPARPRKPAYLAAGLLTGWMLVLDYSGLVAILALGLYALVRWYRQPAPARSFSDLAMFGLGVGACMALLMGYQWMAFGNPILPAQSYMPETQYSGIGFRGMSLPQLDLLWEVAFSPRYGLFTSAPLLLLALNIPGWLSRQKRPFGNLETAFMVVFTLGFFLFTAANQFSRLQFNSGVRHVVPVTPFVFLLAAVVLVQLPGRLAVVFGALATYWSWCLAMYRDVELGRGIVESIFHISTQGPRLPWLATLENLGMAPKGMLALPVLAVAAGLVWLIWRIQWPRRSNLRLFREVKGEEPG